jgi:hypothetical protein
MRWLWKWEHPWDRVEKRFACVYYMKGPWDRPHSILVVRRPFHLPFVLWWKLTDRVPL